MKITKNRLITYEWILLIIQILIITSFVTFRFQLALDSVFSLVWLSAFFGYKAFSNSYVGFIVQGAIYLLLLVFLIASWKRNTESRYIFLHISFLVATILHFLIFFQLLSILHDAAGV